MQEKYRLKRRNDFRKVFRNGTSIANRQFVVYSYRNNEGDSFRVGISISKKIGNAVTRNRIKRLIKEVIRHWSAYISSNHDLILIARKPSASMDYTQMKASLLHLFKKADLFDIYPPKDI